MTPVATKCSACAWHSSKRVEVLVRANRPLWEKCTRKKLFGRGIMNVDALSGDEPASA